ncbi:hypothetical protein CK203_072186 [Vitis vinifera]|uniref:Uncharacterized protein n=1 Tax=Vitis vinifera TaxID=29760 RepID=A0A438BVG0_VITVI|nr:hypothetical protein CK203_072186 [Vitis vinifera]
MARYIWWWWGCRRLCLAFPEAHRCGSARRYQLGVQSLMSQAVDVNYIGTVSLRVKCQEFLLREEEADEVEIQYRDFVTDVTPLFAAAHSGHVSIARKLLVFTNRLGLFPDFFLPCDPGMKLY